MWIPRKNISGCSLGKKNIHRTQKGIFFFNLWRGMETQKIWALKEVRSFHYGCQVYNLGGPSGKGSKPTAWADSRPSCQSSFLWNPLDSAGMTRFLQDLGGHCKDLFSTASRCGHHKEENFSTVWKEKNPQRADFSRSLWYDSHMQDVFWG